MLTSGAIALVSDLICQQCFTLPPPPSAPSPSKKSIASGNVSVSVTRGGTGGFQAVPVDWDRTARFTFINIAYVPVALHLWYGMLSRRVPSLHLRVLFDQVVFAPVSITLFFALNTSLAALQKQGRAIKWGVVVSDVKQSLRDELATTMVANWIVWIPAISFNFRFVAPPLRVLFSNFIGFFWNVYLSSRAGRAATKKEECISFEEEDDDK